MRLFRAMKGIYNVGLRGSTLVLRFVLSFYIIKSLGFEASGIYGLAVGVIGITPAVVGWGLNYYVSRDVVGKSSGFAGERIKSRLLVTTISLTLVTILSVIVTLALGYEINHLYVLVVVVVWLETYALDIHVPLIAQEMALEANVLVFTRSALWVPFVTVGGILFPALRNLETVFACWILSYVVTIAVLFYFIRKWPLRETAKAPIHYDWIKDRLKASYFIYFSDLSIVGLIYADRYIVNFMLGLTLTGIYTFYWSLTNALQTLISTAVVQLALPVLFKAASNGSTAEWRHTMNRQFIKTTAMACGMGLAVWIGCELLIRYLSMSQLGEHRGVFLLLLMASIVRSISDLLNVGLTSLKKDNHYATINLLGVCLAIGVATVMIAIFGFVGTGIAALVTALIIAGLRAAYLFNFTR